MEQTQPQTRYRINVKTSTAGKQTYDCTVESTILTREEMLAESDSLVEELEKRYPSKPEDKKEKEE